MYVYIMAQAEKASYTGKISPSDQQAKPNNVETNQHCLPFSVLTYTNAQQSQDGCLLLSTQCDFFPFL